jgi:hypothetical protein
MAPLEATTLGALPWAARHGGPLVPLRTALASALLLRIAFLVFSRRRLNGQLFGLGVPLCSLYVAVKAPWTLSSRTFTRAVRSLLWTNLVFSLTPMIPATLSLVFGITFACALGTLPIAGCLSACGTDPPSIHENIISSAHHVSRVLECHCISMCVCVSSCIENICE